MKLKRVYMWRGFLVAPLLVFSLGCFFGEYENDVVIWPLGILLFLAGWTIRIWAQKHLGYRLKVKRSLTSSGPYALVRNPIYIGNTLLIVAAVVASEVLWMIPLTLLWCAAVYSLVVRYEERHLAEKYGEAYLSYLTAVPRWLPRFANPATSSYLQAPLRQAVLAELCVLLVMGLPLVKEIFIAPWIE